MRYQILLVASLVFVLAACATTVAPLQPTPTPTAIPSPTASPTPVMPGAQGTLQRLLQRQNLLIGIIPQARAPFILPSTEAGPEGLDIALAQAFARVWTGRSNALSWHLNATTTDLAEGRVDLLMGGLVHTRAAETEIDFSQTYWWLDGQPVAIGVAPNDSLMRDVVNATLQKLVQDGQWAALVRSATAAEPDFSPELWPGDIPTARTLSARSQARPAASRLAQASRLRIAYMQASGFVATGNESGFLPDLARALHRRLLGNEDVLLVPYRGTPALDFQDFDLFLGPLVHDWQAEPAADFSLTYYADGLALLARQGSGIGQLQQLDRRPVALLQDASSQKLYEQAIAQLGIDPVLFMADTNDEAIAMLQDSKVDAILVHGYPAARLLAAHIPDAMLAPGRQGPTLPMAIALPANDSLLRDAVNLALQDMVADGVLQELTNRYFAGDTLYPIETWPPQ